MLSKFVFTSLFSLALAATPALAADVYVVHGINGTDIGQAQELLVDIEVNGVCALEDVPFTTVAGPITFDTGDSRVTVRLSDGIPMSCTGTIVVDQDVNVAAFETAVVVAQLDENNTISLAKYSVDNSALEIGETRITVAHGAVAPAVNVNVKRTDGPGGLRIKQIRNGDTSFPGVASSGLYDVIVKLSFAKGPSAKFTDIPVDGNVVVVAAGSLANGTFTLIPVLIQP